MSIAQRFNLTDSEANDEDAIDQFAWIPQEMLHAVHRAVGAEAR